MKKNIFKTIAILLLVAGVVACKKEKAPDVLFVDGIVIAESLFASFPFTLVQVSEKYPIGASMNFTEDMRRCYTFDEVGLYQNLIMVQSSGKSFGDRNDQYTIGDRISFSYREFNRESDKELFEGIHPLDVLYYSTQDTLVSGCGSFPTIPTYVITDYTILK
jgi:hypothetical protein